MRDRNPKVAEIPFNSTNKYQVWLGCGDTEKKKGDKNGESGDSVEESKPTETQQKEIMEFI